MPGLGFHVQQRFDRNRTADLWPIANGVRRIVAILDGSAELGFASLEDQGAFAKAGTILYGDEFNLFSEAIAYNLPSGSLTFVARDPDAYRNGAKTLHRLYVYMNRKAGTGADAWLKDISRTLCAHDEILQWKPHLPQQYDSARPAPHHPTWAISFSSIALTS